MDQFMVDVTDIDGIENGDGLCLLDAKVDRLLWWRNSQNSQNVFIMSLYVIWAKEYQDLHKSEKVVCLKDYFDDVYNIYE